MEEEEAAQQLDDLLRRTRALGADIQNSLS
jgi:hypothetical protein